jgi:hypothetical protein
LFMSFVNTLPFCSRSRFFVKLVGSQTGSSGDSPTNQHYIVVQLLHQLSFRPNSVQHLHSNCSGGIEGHLRSNRAYQATVQLAQHITDKRPDPSQQMVRRHQRLGEMYENSRP